MSGGGDPPDDDPFERAIRGSRPLERDGTDPARRRPRPRPRAAEGKTDGGRRARLHIERDGESVRGAVDGVNDLRLGELARGEIEPAARLELHGLREEVARRRTLDFLAARWAARDRCVQIIHGRGARSPGGVGVLREALPGWLETAAARGQVLAFASAPTRLGGPGATLVLLRRG
jgi:DNA-nicking Smr family endonuclease